MEAVQSPPWASLPSDRYVLSQWTLSTEANLDERRRQLVREFTAIGDVGRYPYCVEDAQWESTIRQPPPQSEWQDILSPMRTDFQRYMALPSIFNSTGFGIIWLRTCYGGDTDAAHSRLIANLNIDLAVNIEQNILDDSDLYNYGREWARIFDVLPERLFQIGIADKKVMDDPNTHVASIRQLQAEFATGILDDHTMKVASQRRIPGESRLLSEEEIDARVYSARTLVLHRKASVNYLFIADEIALETGMALVVFFDDCGRTVRQARISPDLCEDTAGAWFNGAITDQPEFDEAEIGPDYMPGGVCGPPYSPQ